MKAAIILSGSGVYDGSEIHEVVLTLLALEENSIEYTLFAPDKSQYHVVNHLTGEVTEESRNVLVESARIGRGNVTTLTALTEKSFDFLIIPGGFGAAKNLNQWAISGPKGDIDSEVKRCIQEFIAAKKPLCGLCMGPTVIAKALENSNHSASLTVGNLTAKSPYNIKEISEGMESIGAISQNKSINEIAIDVNLKIVSAPCYMMEASLLQVRANIQNAIIALIKLASDV